MRIEVVANAFDHFMAYANRAADHAAQQEMEMINQKVDAMILRSNRIRMFLGGPLRYRASVTSSRIRTTERASPARAR